MARYRPLFCLFSFFSHSNMKYSINVNYVNLKSIDVMPGIRTWGHMMVGADGSTELLMAATSNCYLVCFKEKLFCLMQKSFVQSRNLNRWSCTSFYYLVVPTSFYYIVVHTFFYYLAVPSYTIQVVVPLSTTQLYLPHCTNSCTYLLLLPINTLLYQKSSCISFYYVVLPFLIEYLKLDDFNAIARSL